MKQFDNLTIPVIFFGSSSYVIPILEVLRKNFDLKLVITTEKNPTDAVPSYCIANKIPYLSISDFSDPSLISHLSFLISHFSPLISPAGVLADFGLIIPKEILNAFPKGIINIHPSLLPKYRGPTPVQTAILNGEKITGVSIIKLDEEIDHGPILGQEKEEILDNDTSESLYKRLFEKGANLLLKVLNFYLKGDLKSIAQNHSKATFTKSLTRNNGFIDVSNLKTAVTKIDTMIRAYYPWPGVWSEIRISKSEIRRIKFLPKEKIQVEGKKPMSYKDFLNGYPQAKTLIERIFDVGNI